MGNVGWGGIIAAGWPVLLILLTGSIVSFAIMFERYKVFKQIRDDSETFLDSIRRNASVAKIIEWCEKSSQPLAKIALRVFQSGPSRDDKERALQYAIQRSVKDLEKGIAVLGSIASVAPFVGLLGTVIGIIKAFRAVSMTTSAGAGLVAVGIAEALVGTAAGLIVAIPALLGYNYYVNRIRRLSQDWELTGSEIIEESLTKKN